MLPSGSRPPSARRALAPALALALLPLLLLGLRCPGSEPGGRVELAGLEHSVRVVVDRFGSPHIFARTDTDMARVQGYVHARDRLWQMDLTRREVNGSLAELLGADALDGDVQNRTVGLGTCPDLPSRECAADRSYASLGAREKEVLEAYAAGVNAWVAKAEAEGTLPPQYAELELSSVEPWRPQDTLAIGKAIAASLSLDIDVGRMEQLEAYVDAGDAQGFDGTALYTQIVRRVAPMDPASTVPDATGETPFLEEGELALEEGALEARARLAAETRERLRASRLLASAMERSERTIGSNEWGVAASVSETGHPIIANDPHLSLNMPSTFYENHLVVRDDPVEGRMNVNGITFAGVPFVILGQNERITWGATTNSMDVSDVFADRLVGRDQECPSSGLWIVSEGECHAVNVQIAEYRANDPDDGVVRGHDEVPGVSFDLLPFADRFIFTVPFRSHGPVIGVEDSDVVLNQLGETTALVLQFTGFHATREVQTFRIWARARSLEEFERGLRAFDFGSQNWAYADADGNLAYFASAELPLRKDLESGEVEGLPPFFVRDGSGPSNWVPDPGRSQGQSIPFAVLPEDEMPQAVNPAKGFFANANNDPAGVTLDNDPLNQRRPGMPEAIYYLAPGYDEGLRAGRITRLIESELAASGEISVEDMKRFQANTQQLDAELMTPFLIAAWRNAGRAGAPDALAALRADPELAEAVGRLEAWDFSTPTGLPEGWDAGDVDGVRGAPSAEERASAVAATLYNVWRAEALQSIVDARLAALGVPGVGSGDALKALHHLLAGFAADQGEPVAGVDFFPEPAGLAPADRRDVALLEALRAALDRLASDAFAPAFGGSTDPEDYLWGKLHRITFDAELPQFSVPPQAGFQDLAPGLPGLARDGGYEVVNASGFGARADAAGEFTFGGGPVRRYVGAAGLAPSPLARVRGFNVIPGGSSGIPGDPLYAKQLPTWLTADYHPVEMFRAEAERDAISAERFVAP